MNCPNCDKELMNVNGRYVCTNCGTEVPEGQATIQSSSPTQVTDDFSAQPEIATESVVTEPVSIPEIDQIEVAAQELPTETVETIPVGENAVQDISDPVGDSNNDFVTAEPNVAELINDQPTDSELPITEEIAEPQVALDNQTEVNPPVEETVDNLVNQIPDVTTVTSEVESVPVMDTVKPTLDSISATEPVSIPINTPESIPTPEPVAASIPEVAPVAEPLSQMTEYQTPTTSPVDPYDVVDTNMATSDFSQNPTSFAQVESTFQTPSAPMPSYPQSDGGEIVYTNNKVLYSILIAGAVVLVILLIVGIIAYFKLTAPVS